MVDTKLKQLVREAVDSHHRTKAELELRKDMAETAEEDCLDMTKKKFNQLAKAAYNLDAFDKKAELEEIIELLDSLDIS